MADGFVAAAQTETLTKEPFPIMARKVLRAITAISISRTATLKRLRCGVELAVERLERAVSAPVGEALLGKGAIRVMLNTGNTPMFMAFRLERQQ
ncbi:hypothetical protein [Ruegeria jejuensis]|uniref:hypothetical protein n=1 Tax=Ruegeria jejuensis TaxID=3233338 RepID=UPI00355BF48B